MALIGIMVSVLLVMIASYELQKEWFSKDQTTGLIFLCLSACFQSFEVCLENRIFIIEKDLSALALQQMISSWKMILLLCTILIGNLFPNSLGSTIGSGLASFDLYNHNMEEQPVLYALMFGVCFFGALAANLGMQIVRAENAVFKQSVMLLAIPSLWLWHIYYGDRIDAYSWFKMISQLCIVISVVLYMIWDREAAEEEKEYEASK